MTMRKYLVTIHEDGRITASEYEEPQGFVYRAGEAAVMRAAYNQALSDIKTVLEAEKARCEVNGKIDFGPGWKLNWASRAAECERIETAIAKLFCES